MEALGMAPVGSPAPEDGVCVACGHPFAKGEPVLLAADQFKASTANVNEKLAHPESPYLCGCCAAVSGNKGLGALKAAVVTEEGVFPIAKDVHRAWLFLETPEPPFVVTVGLRQKEHLIWRVPPTLSRDLIVARVSDQLYQIRRPKILEAIERCDRLGRHPFVRLDREAGDLNHGAIRHEWDKELQKMRPVIEGDDWSFFVSLWPGELWALSALVKKNRPEPQRPDPLPKS